MSILNPRIRPNDNESLCVINSLLKAFKDEIDLRKLPKQFFTVSCFSLKSIGRSNAMVLAFKGHFLLGISFSESELQKFSTSECYKSSYVSLFEIKTTSNQKNLNENIFYSHHCQHLCLWSITAKADCPKCGRSSARARQFSSQFGEFDAEKYYARSFDLL